MEYKYFAFISYKREDEKWAKWLQNKLESYHIPSIIRNENPDLPKYVRPIFRDKTDLTAGALDNVLKNELELSKYLIVICSPNAVKSEWVGKEIRYFKNIRGENSVLPFIVDGEPYSQNPQQECYHNELKNFKEEPLGISINDAGKSQAFVRIVAALLNVSFDTLWGRHTRKRRLQVFLYTMLSICVATLITMLCLYEMTRCKYYADYVEKWGVPQGIHELSINEVRQRVYSYKMEYSRGKLRHLQLINSKGKQIDHSDSDLKATRFPEVKYFYSDKGILDYKEIYNQYGDMMFRIDYSDNLLTATFRRNDKYGTEMNIRAKTTETLNVNTSEKSAITRYLLQYDENGYLTEKRYAGFQNVLVSDADNIYGVRYINDEKGRVIESQFLGRNGSITTNSNGLAIKTFSYDADDNWVGVSYLNAERGPSHDGNNCSVVLYPNDKYGNKIGEYYQTLDGKPACRNDGKYFGILITIEDGLAVAYTTLNQDGKPAYNQCHYVTKKFEYDENGYAIKKSFYDDNDSICEFFDIENNIRYSMSTATYDENGRLTSYSIFDKNGNLCESNGVAKWEHKYDEWGNEISQINYSSKNQRALDDEYVCQYNSYYDSLHQLIKMECIDTLGNLTVNKDGYAYVEISYDIHGQTIVIAYYDKDGKSVMNADYYAKRLNEYSEAGRLVKSKFFDVQGNLTLTKNGFAEVVFEYDESTGFNTSNKFYNISNNLMQCNRYEYDDRGNEIKRFTLDANGKLSNGTYVGNFKYDELNRNTEYWISDLNGVRVDDEIGVCSIIKTIDASGNEIEYSYWDSKGNPVIDNLKTHKRVHELDAFNRVIHEWNYGIDGKPITGKGVYPEGTVVYDKFGHKSEIACYDGYGVPILGADGIHKSIMIYNNDNLLVQHKFLDINDNLTMSVSLDYAQCDYKYDGKRNCTEEIYYDVQPQRIRVVNYSYNSRNEVTEELRMDANGIIKITTMYEEDDVTPRRRRKECYSNGKIFAYSTFDKQTGEWSDWIPKRR